MPLHPQTPLVISSLIHYKFFFTLTGDKPHACELCNKRFALACNLRAHMKTHDDEQQENCVRCGRIFLASSGDIKSGICQKCEDEPICVDDQAEEIEEAVNIRHKKFSNKAANSMISVQQMLRKLNAGF